MIRVKGVLMTKISKSIGLCFLFVLSLSLIPDRVYADSTSASGIDFFRATDGTEYELNEDGDWVPVQNEPILTEDGLDASINWETDPWLLWNDDLEVFWETDPSPINWGPASANPGGTITVYGELSKWISTDIISLEAGVYSGNSDLVFWEVNKLVPGPSPSPTPSLSTYKGPLTNLTFGSTNMPNGRTYALKYQVVVDMGSNDKVIILEQDEISRVRQEYIDMNRHRYPGDPTPTVPAYNDIVYHTSGYYYAGEFVTSSNNISNNRGVMHLELIADDIADEIPGKLSYSGKPWLTSGYRRPTLNASMGGTANSLHQFGYALDFTPPWNNPSMADLLDLEVEIQDLLGLLDYDTLVHNGDHVHVEAQTVSQGGETYLKPAIVSDP